MIEALLSGLVGSVLVWLIAAVLDFSDSIRKAQQTLEEIKQEIARRNDDKE